MSIINDALKKVQANLHSQNPNSRRAETTVVRTTHSAGATLAADFPQPLAPHPQLENIFPATAPIAEAQKEKRISIKKTTLERILVSLCALICVSLAGFMGYLLYLSRATHEPAVVETMKDFTINGIMTMNDKKVVLINNQIYEVGETVDGMKIIDIEMDKIKLLKGDQLKTLIVKKK